jgi:hypothetical protein
MTTFGLVPDRVRDPAGGARLARFGARATWLEGGHRPMLAPPEELSDALTAVPT